MTRINIIPPKQLMDQHLIAEYREIRLLTANLQRTLESKKGFQEKKVPKNYKLDTGHVYFFFPKGKYIHKRYEEIRKEMTNRGFANELEFERDKWPDFLYNDWVPELTDYSVIHERIQERINAKPHFYKYYGKNINRIYYEPTNSDI